MTTTLVRSVLLASAYSPLFLILGIRLWTAAPTSTTALGHWTRIAAVASIALAPICVAALLLFLRDARRDAPIAIRADSAEPAYEQVLGYVISYLFPFLGVDFTDIANVAALGTVYATIWVIQIRSNLIHINPLLLVLNYHTLRLTEPSGRTRVLITHHDYLDTTKEVRAMPLGNHVLLESE